MGVAAVIINGHRLEATGGGDMADLDPPLFSRSADGISGNEAGASEQTFAPTADCALRGQPVAEAAPQDAGAPLDRTIVKM
jgi:hypothetical protein